MAAAHNTDSGAMTGSPAARDPAPDYFNTTTGPSPTSRTRPLSLQDPPRPSAAAAAAASLSPTALKRAATNVPPLASSSAGSTPKTSRSSSPQRKDAARPHPLTTPSTTPSAAAIQRALSAASVPSLHQGVAGASDPASKLPQRSVTKSAGTSAESTPQWPLSPRLKSPPPQTRKGLTGVPKRPDNPTPSLANNGNIPSISLDNPTPPPTTPTPNAATPSPKQAANRDVSLSSTPRSPVHSQAAKLPARGPSGRSTLETVQETSHDSIAEPLAALQAAVDLRPLSKISDEGEAAAPPAAHTDGAVEEKPQSGSDSGGNKSDRQLSRQPSMPRNAGNIPASKLSHAAHAPKSRKADGPGNMTVETETVQSIPQSALSTGDRSLGSRGDNSGTLRLKPSSETIRPRKERKKVVPKPRSINQGTISSKADIFEARVASAVDEANSSDSEETFVYESNPPEQPHRRPRHHSRTPSVTSANSVADLQRSAIRSFGEPLLDERRVAGKRSMKFSSNPMQDPDSPADPNGTVRSYQPRHIGRYGQRGSSQTAMYDPDSPFTQASKLKSSVIGARNSRPGSPRSPHNSHLHQHHQPRQSALLFGKKNENSFDLGGEGADDERTPLVGSLRTPRSARSRRLRTRDGDDIDPYFSVRRHSRCGGKWAGCLLGFFVVAIVVASAVGFLVMSNRPMSDVRIKKIQNVLASEQEIMLDLMVGAVNPNALGITVSDMDVNIFARTKHLGDGNKTVVDEQLPPAVARDPSRRRQRRPTHLEEESTTPPVGDPNGWQDLSGHWHPPSSSGGGVDEGTDPDKDLEKDSQTVLLGSVFHFDQALTFEGSPIKRHAHYSLGELRLTRPGNKTADGGSAKWKKILHDPFELIIRGVLKYQLPISSRTISAAVSASVLVHPEGDVDDAGNMRIEPIRHDDHWQWIDWDEVRDSDGIPPAAAKEQRLLELEEAEP